VGWGGLDSEERGGWSRALRRHVGRSVADDFVMRFCQV
jgi:hypothetical protein